MLFQPAVRQAGKLKMALTGPSGSGKTLTAMRIIRYLSGDKPWCVLDTENGTAAKYSGYGGFQFDHAIPEDNHPSTFVTAIYEAYKAGYAGLIIDSLSHEWVGKGGCLETVNNLASKDRSKNSYVQWAHVTPAHNELFEKINRAPIHIICTLRVKMGYELQKNDNNKVVPVKMGLEPVTRDGAEYEFDVVMDMHETIGRIAKTRCPQLQDKVFDKPGEEVAEVLRAWLNGETPATMLSFLNETNSEKFSETPAVIVAEPSASAETSK